MKTTKTAKATKVKGGTNDDSGSIYAEKHPALKVTKSSTAKFVRRSMLTYGSYVIGNRAVADVRDGLKPVQRRILWAMHELGAKSTVAHRKSAKIAGDTMGNFHPHGDAAIYDTMVNMVFARYPLIDGHGNFGNRVGTIEEDPAAASRYTEARLTKFGEAIIEDFADVDYTDNYSGDRKEPVYFNPRVPLLLLNGSLGIGVGMSASLPPHNLGEVIDACIAAVKNENITTKGLMKFIHGPDHGYGVLLSPPEDVLALYKTGKGSLAYRCEYSLEKDKGNNLFVVTSPAPGFNPNRFMAAMAKLQEDRLVDWVRNESKGKGALRIVVAYKDVRILRERIIPAVHTSESYQFYAIAPDGGETLSSDTLALENLKAVINKFVVFRREAETRRTKRLLGVAKHSLKKQRAMLTGTVNVKTVAAVVDNKRNKTLDDMRKDLVTVLNPKITDPKYKLDEEGAGFILETAIWKLGRLNVPELKAKIAELVSEVKGYLHDLKHIDKVVVKRMEEMRKFSGVRGTKLREKAAEVAGGASKGYVVARSNGQVLKIGNTIPTDAKRVTYDFVSKVSDRALAVTTKGAIKSFHLAYSTEEKYSGGVVGLGRDTDAFIAVVDESGRGVCVDPSSKKDEVNAIKNHKGKLVSATGVGKNESLVCLTKSGTGYIIPAKDCKVTRANVLAYQIAEDREKVTAVYRMPSNAVLYAGTSAVKVKGNKFTYDDAQPFYVVGPKNYAVLKNEKGIFDAKEVIAAIRAGKCKHSVLAD